MSTTSALASLPLLTTQAPERPGVSLPTPVGRLAPPSTPARPFLKWVGGKRRLVEEILRHVPGGFRAYHEPFLGGGALFFGIAAGMPPEAGATLPWATLTDMNPRLIRTWRAIRDDVQAVIDRLREHSLAHSVEHFNDMRGWSVDEVEDDADVAAWMVYLNKTAYNGLYRVNSKGRFNTPWGKYENPNICDEENLRACARVLMGVDIEHSPFERVLDRAVAGDFVYLDPPYVPVSETASFTAYTREGFGPADQARVRDVALTLKARGVTVVVSNSDTGTTRALYGPEFKHRVVLMPRAINSAAGGRGAVPELLVW